MRRTQQVIISLALLTNVVTGFVVSIQKSTPPHQLFGVVVAKELPISTTPATTTLLTASRTIEAPVREKTDQDTGTTKKRRQEQNDNNDSNDNDNNNYSDLEYLMDPSSLRGDNDPFHILLLGSTFHKPKVTISYVSTTLEFVLDMPYNDGIELSQFAIDIGMSCLGTWPHEQCINYGKQLQNRDIVCRVVPYCEGGQRGWQAKDTNDSTRYDKSSSSSSSSS
jgi:hypothetical protein